MELQSLNFILSNFLKGLETVKSYIPSKKAKIGKHLRKVIDILEDVTDRAKLITDELETIEKAKDYTVKRVYSLFYDQIVALQKLNRILARSDLFSLFKIYDKETYNNLLSAIGRKMSAIEMFIGYLYEDKICLYMTPRYDIIDQFAFEGKQNREMILKKFFSERGSVQKITLTKDDYNSCRKELAKIDVNRAKESVSELDKISGDLKTFVIENFNISDLF